MIQDLFVPVVTPFAADGTIDRRALAAHSEWVCAQGASGVMLFGTTGEGPSISAREKVVTAGQLLEDSPGLAVIGSVTETSIVDAFECVRGYNQLGVEGTLILPPGYFREGAGDGFFRYFELLSQASDHPVLAYHIPSLAPAVDLAMVADLGLWGVKDSGGDLSFTRAALTAGLGVMVGAEAVVTDAVALGANGAISGMANVMPAHVAGMCRAARDGELEEANRLRDEVLSLQAAMAVAAPGFEWIAAMKALAGHRQGIDLGAVRPPLLARHDYLTTELLARLDPAAAVQ